MSDLDLGIAFHINDSEVEQSNERVKKRIRETGDAVKRQEGLIERLQRAVSIYQNAIAGATLEQNIEKYNRKLQATQDEIRRLNALGTQSNSPIEQNAIRATRSFNGLQNSINQISRELPAFTYSAQTGFMAVSNNIPILVDEINRLRAANAAATASGQAATPVWKQLTSALFSWGTGLSVGITLFTVYGREIGSFISSLFKGKEAINTFIERQKALNDVYKNSNKDIASQTANLRYLYAASTDLNNVMDKRLAAAKELQREFPKTFGLQKAENIINGEASAIYQQLTKDIIANARAKAGAARISEEEGKILDAEFKQAKVRGANMVEIEAAVERERKRLKKDGFSDAKAAEFIAEQLNHVGKKHDDEDVTTAATQLVAQIESSNKRANTALTAEKQIIEKAKNNVDFIERALGGKTAIGNAITNGASGKAPTTKTEDTAFANAINAKKNVLDKLSDLDAEYSRKSFTKDEEELQALKDKFTAFRRIIAEENQKIAEYNKTHKKQIGAIDITQVDPIEKNATADLIYRQDTDKLKISLDKQKELYHEFEQYKNNLGESAAVQRYGKELDTAKTYLDVLGAEYANLTAAQSKGTLTGPQQERLKLVKTAIDAEQKLTNDNYIKLLADNQSYEQKRLTFQENALAKVRDMRKKGDVNEAETLRAKSEAELTELDKQHVQQLKSYTGLFNNIDRLSTASLRKGIDNLKKEVSKLKLTPEAEEFFKRMFGDLERRASSQDANDWKGIASSLSEAARYAGDLDENLGQALGVAANLAGQVGNIKQGLADFSTAKGEGNVMGQISSGLGILSSVMGIFSGIAGLFDNSKRAAEQMQHSQELQLKATEAVTKALERQFGLIKEVYGTERLVAYKKQLDDISTAQNKANEALKNKLFFTGNKVIDKYIEQYNKGIKNGFFNTDDIINQIDAQYAIAGKTIKELQELLDKGLLDSSTAAIVQSLIDLEQQAKAVRNALTEEITGVNFDSLTDKIKGVFDSGETSAKNFADAIETSIQGAFSNAFKRKEIEQRMQPLFDALYKAGEDGSFTSDEIKTLRDMRDKISQELADRAKVYEQIIGPNPNTSNGNTNSLQGAYKTASQASIDLLSANTGGLRLAAVEGNNLAKVGNATMADSLTEIRKQSLTLIEIRDAAKATATNTGSMDATLKSIDSKMDNNNNYQQGMGRGG